MKNKLRYFINWFPFQYGLFKGRLGMFDFFYSGPNVIEKNSWYAWKTIRIDDGTEYKLISGYHYILQNFLLLRNLYKRGEVQKYDIVQMNNTENFLNFKKVPNQISIAESHGFDFGVNYSRYLKDEKNILKKYMGWIIDRLIWWKIRQKIQEFDIYYCSTPDMVGPLQELVRKDVKWFPNPINIDIFKPEWDTIKLEWNPACFFPTRLHGDKKPEYAIKIFQEYIKPNYPGATLHLLNQWFEVQKYREILSDPETYFWHDFMDKETLAAKIRGSDYCFWDFSIGGLSLMPMQIMACKKPIITYDMHELIKVEREDLLGLTKRLFEDEKFKQEYVERNYRYILDFHSEKAICRIHLENIKPFLKSKLHLSEEEINNLSVSD